MHSRVFVTAVSFVALVAVSACGSNSPMTPSPSPSPAPSNQPAPAPAPTPAPTPAPAPAPGAAFAFTSDTASPASRSYSLQPAGDADGGDLWVALHAKDFGTDAVNMVRANITFDPSVVSLISFSSADSWMEKFGYQSTFSVTKSGTNLIRIRVDMQSTSAGASGSGRILRLRFRRVGPGSSHLEFSDSKAYDAGFNDSLQATHGGTLVVK